MSQQNSKTNEKLIYNLRLRSPQWVQNISIASVGFGVFLYLAIGPTLMSFQLSQFGLILIILGLLTSPIFAFSTKKIRFVVSPNEQKLIIPNGTGRDVIFIKGSRFCWGYPEKMSNSTIGSKRTISQVCLHLDLLSVNDKRILITSHLPVLVDKPSSWPVIKLPSSGLYDYQIMVFGGLKKMKRDIEKMAAQKQNGASSLTD